MNRCVEYFKTLAARLRAFSRSCFDLGTAGELRRVSAEMDSKAEEMCRGQERSKR